MKCFPQLVSNVSIHFDSFRTLTVLLLLIADLNVFSIWLLLFSTAIRQTLIEFNWNELIQPIRICHEIGSNSLGNMHGSEFVVKLRLTLLLLLVMWWLLNKSNRKVLVDISNNLSIGDRTRTFLPLSNSYCSVTDCRSYDSSFLYCRTVHSIKYFHSIRFNSRTKPLILCMVLISFACLYFSTVFIGVIKYGSN